jgi:hypothetical protein
VETASTDVETTRGGRNAPEVLSDAVADALYIGVGLTILGIQRTNVARRALRADAERVLGTPLTLPAIAARAAEVWEQTLGARSTAGTNND